MKVNVGDDWNFRNTLADLFERNGRIVVWHGQSYNLAAGADHLFDLLDGSVNIRGVGLRHGLNDHGRAAADLHVLDLNWSGFSHQSDYLAGVAFAGALLFGPRQSDICFNASFVSTNTISRITKTNPTC